LGAARGADVRLAVDVLPGPVLHSDAARLTWGFSWEVNMVESIKAVAAFLKAVGKGMLGLSVLLLFGFLLYAFIAA
jgi:hypothetical protein